MVALAPVLLAGIASVLAGWLWYSPHLFGRAWVRLANLAPEQIERGRKFLPLEEFVGLLMCMLVAYVMALIGIQFQIATLAGAIELGFLCWIGFCVPTAVNQVLWDQKPFALFLINTLYWLLAFLLIAFILFYTAAI